MKEKKEHEKFKKIVFNIFKDLYKIDETCVKIWQADHMSIYDVFIGCDYVKRIGCDTIIYNNIVPFKEKLSKETGITILDGNDLILKCIRNDKLLKFEGMIHYNK